MIRLMTAALALGALLGSAGVAAAADYLVLELKSGKVKIELLDDVAPNHVERVKTLAKRGAYDGIAFHRVIEDFMAQTGDVQYGTLAADGTVSRRVGTGGSDLPDLEQEFSDVPFDRGVVGAARSQSVNSANSQFFIMFAEGHFLNNQYTVWGRVAEGMEHVDNIKMGSRANNGSVDKPDQMIRAYIESE